MYRFFLVLLLVFTIGFSNELDKDYYNEALQSYKAKDYEKSYEMFSKLFVDNFDNTLINFYLGRSAFELGKYEFALSAYDRILINEPTNTRVRIELAQTYLQMGLLPQSLKEFQISLQNEMPELVRKRVEANINFIRKKQQKHFFNVSGMYSIIYDSNVNAAADGGTFDIYSPTLGTDLSLTNDGKQDSATIHLLAVPISYKYKLKENFIIDSSFVPLFMRYRGFKDKNIDALSLNISPTYYNQDYKIGISFLHDLVYLGHKKYQSNSYIKPFYSKVIFNNFLYETSLKLGKVNYADTKDRGSFHSEFANNIKYASESFGIFDFGISLGKENELYSTRTDVTNKFYSFSLSNNFNIFDDYTLKSAVSYERTKYIDEDVNFLSKREDKEYNYSLELQKPITKKLSFLLGSNFININSNQEPFSYDKYTLKASIFYSF